MRRALRTPERWRSEVGLDERAYVAGRKSRNSRTIKAARADRLDSDYMAAFTHSQLLKSKMTGIRARPETEGW